MWKDRDDVQINHFILMKYNYLINTLSESPYVVLMLVLVEFLSEPVPTSEDSLTSTNCYYFCVLVSSVSFRELQ